MITPTHLETSHYSNLNPQYFNIVIIVKALHELLHHHNQVDCTKKLKINFTTMTFDKVITVIFFLKHIHFLYHLI